MAPTWLIHWYFLCKVGSSRLRIPLYISNHRRSFEIKKNRSIQRESESSMFHLLLLSKLKYLHVMLIKKWQVFILRPQKIPSPWVKEWKEKKKKTDIKKEARWKRKQNINYLLVTQINFITTDVFFPRKLVSQFRK